MVEFLLNSGADATYRDFKSLETCLHIACSQMSGEFVDGLRVFRMKACFPIDELYSSVNDFQATSRCR